MAGLLAKIGFGSAKSAADDVAKEGAEQAAKASSAWARNLRKATLGSAAIGGGAYGIGSVGDAYESQKSEAETAAWLEQREQILNDPHLSSEEKGRYLDSLTHPEKAGSGGLMDRLNNLSITGAIMLVAFGYLGIRALNVLGGMA